jgi:ornithine carbamoyltransferase
MTDFLSIRDFTPRQIRHLLGLAARIKAHPSSYASELNGQTLALIFEKPSLRTRVTFDLAMRQLGGYALYLSPAEISLGKRESVHDVAKNLERMVQAIMIRTFAHEIVESMAEHASVPVINGLTDFSHPCQALADYLTMWETKGKLAGLKVAYVGDGNNVAHSLMFTGAQLGADVWVATPPNFEPASSAIYWARERALQTGGVVVITNDPAEAAYAADVIYTDVWTSMGQEAQKESRLRAFAAFQVNHHLMNRAKPDALFMHCLPAHRGEEVTNDVIDSPQSVVFQQAENRLHAHKAILLELLKQQVADYARAPEEEEVHA